MRFDADIRYEASPERAFEMLQEPAFLDKVCLDNGAVEHSVSVEPTNARVALEGLRVVLTRSK